MNNVLRNRLSFKGSWLPGLLILSLIAVNLLLARQNFAMRRQLNEHAKVINPTAKSLKKGEAVTSLVGSDLRGQPYQVDYRKDERKHLLLFFSPGCAYCVQQAHLWRDVLNKVDGNRVEVVGIVSDREDQKAVFTHAEELGYLKTRTPLPVLFVSNDSLARYKLAATPTTLLVSSDGNVEHVWVGKWDETQTNEVAAALK